MYLNMYNDTLTKQQNAVDNYEIRAHLFQGAAMYDLYGETNYLFWPNLDPTVRTEDHLKDMRYVLSLSKEERSAKLKNIMTSQLKSQA